MIPLKNLDAPKFYNCQFWAPSFQILVKTLDQVVVEEVCLGGGGGGDSTCASLAHSLLILIVRPVCI